MERKLGRELEREFLFVPNVRMFEIFLYSRISELVNYYFGERKLERELDVNSRRELEREFETKI